MPVASPLAGSANTKASGKHLKRPLTTIASVDPKADSDDDFHSADSGSDSDKKSVKDSKKSSTSQSSTPSPAVTPTKRQVLC